MTKRILKEVILFILLILAVSFISFLLLDLSPIDPIASFARAKSIGLSPNAKQELIKQWGLDQPLMIRFFSWIKHLIRGDLGISNIYGREVLDIIREGFSRSILLMSLAWTFQGLIGIGLGIIAGANAGRLKDKIIRAYAIVFASTPSFWVGILLIIVFSLKLKIFPSSMGSPVGVLKADITFVDTLKHLVLPALTLILVGVSNLILHTRSKVIDILNSDYVLYAKARGMKKSQILNKFAFKNLILPGLSLLFTSFSELFSGTVLVENVFNYPGIGNLTVEAGLRGDAPLLLGLVLFSSVFVYLGNRICDLLYLLIDPRLRGIDETRK